MVEIELPWQKAWVGPQGKGGRGGEDGEKKKKKKEEQPFTEL